MDSELEHKNLLTMCDNCDHVGVQEYLKSKQITDIDGLNLDGTTALVAAFRPKPRTMMSEQNSLILLLLRRGASPARPDADGNIPMHVCHADHLDLLSRYHSGVNVQNKAGETPLMLAADVEKASNLLDLKADVNAVDVNGNTALHHHVFANRYDIVDLLLHQNVDVNVRNKHGYTPLFMVRNKRLAELLLGDGSREIDVNAKDEHGNTPLHAIASRNDAEGVKFLLEKGADPNTRNGNGQTPLFYATGVKTITVLLENTAHFVDVNAKDNKNNTALHVFAKNERFQCSLKGFTDMTLSTDQAIDCMKLLMDVYNAESSIVNDENCTITDFAHDDIKLMLQTVIRDQGSVRCQKCRCERCRDFQVQITKDHNALVKKIEELEASSGEANKRLEKETAELQKRVNALEQQEQSRREKLNELRQQLPKSGSAPHQYIQTGKRYGETDRDVVNLLNVFTGRLLHDNTP